jgi:hypothetical protein
MIAPIPTPIGCAISPKSKNKSDLGEEVKGPNPLAMAKIIERMAEWMMEQKELEKKMNVFYRRELTELEEKVLEFVKTHPRLTTYDIAEKFDHSEAVYYAVPYLVCNLYADQDKVTGAITMRENQS